MKGILFHVWTFGICSRDMLDFFVDLGEIRHVGYQVFRVLIKRSRKLPTVLEFHHFDLVVIS